MYASEQVQGDIHNSHKVNRVKRISLGNTSVMLREGSFCWCENEIALKTYREMNRNERSHNTFYSVIF